VIGIADALAEVFVGFQPADFKDELGVTVIENGDLRVGGFSLVLVAEAATDADYALGKRGAGDSPSSFIDFVHALIADVAVAEIPKPVPVVVDEVAVIGAFLSWAEPQIEVELIGRGSGLLETDARATLVAKTA
jgi:hypothetical protein